MEFVIAAPEYVSAAAADLANIGSSISSANTVASGPTSSVAAAGADVVSEMIATLFTAHAQAYQQLSDAAAQFHSQFVQLMNSGAGEYAATEAANASPLQTVKQDVLGMSSSPGQTPAGLPPAVSSFNAAANVFTTGAAPAASVAAGGPVVSGALGQNGGIGGGFAGAVSGSSGARGVLSNVEASSASVEESELAAGAGGGNGASGGLLPPAARAETVTRTAAAPQARAVNAEAAEGSASGEAAAYGA